MPKTQTLKLLCPHCDKLVKVTYSIDAKGVIQMQFTQFHEDDSQGSG